MPLELNKLAENYKTVLKSYKPPKRINLILEDRLLEKVFLGRWQLFGYENNPNNGGRILASVIQTIWGCIALWTLISVILHFSSNSIAIKSDSAIVSIAGIIALILSGCIVSERANLYTKFNYLAQTFNDIIKIDTLNANLVHRIGCLAHDILVMEMWNHRSFNAAFNEALIWAVLIKNNYDPDITIRDLNDFKIQGIKYDNANELIAELIAASAPI